MGTGGGDGGAVESERGLRIHRSRAAEKRALSIGRRRQDVAGARPQSVDDLAAVLLCQFNCRSEEREQDLQARPRAHRQH